MSKTESKMEVESESGSEESSDDELMAGSDVEQMEKMDFDFEALPPHESDLVGIVNLVTQIFLRTDVDCEGLANRIIEQSPLGCVYKPTEECEDDEEGAEGLVYGLLSIVDLHGAEKFKADIADFLMQRANKHADKEIIQQLRQFFPKSSKNEGDSKAVRIGMVVNERMLHFPDQIAGPAFQSLGDDLKNMLNADSFQHVMMIVKIRVSEDSQSGSTSSKSLSMKAGIRKKKKKMGKAEKKRLAAAKVADADILFDNAEEALLFQVADPVYFQYPVHADVEKTSKFHSSIRNGTTYKPYRRVCILSIEQFREFIGQVIKLYA